LKKKELAVGDSTQIELIHHASLRGKIRKSATVSTSDTLSGQVRLSYSGEIGSLSDSTFLVIVEPEILDFAPKDGKQETKLKTTIVNNSDQKLTLRIIDYPEDLCKPVLRSKYLKPDKKTELLVKLDRRVKLDRIEKSITFELDDKNKTRFTVPITKVVKTKKPPPKKISPKKPVKKKGG